MKIIQIGPYPPPLGGWSFHIEVFKNYLDSLNIDNDVLDIGENRRIKGRSCIDVQGITDYIVKVFSYCRKEYCIYIHLNGNSLTGLILTIIAQCVALLNFKKCLLSFHAGTAQKCFTKGLSVQKAIAWLSFKLSSGIICNNDAVKECILVFGIPDKRVYPIPCFSMQYIKHEYELTTIEESFLDSHFPLFTSYVFFREEYDPDTLIEALKLLKNKYPSFGAVIIGSLEGSEPYQQMIKNYDLEDNILLVGEKNHDNFLTIVEKSHLFLRTPVSDGVCSSVMEALALKVPVVASDNSNRPQEVVLFTPGDSASLAEKVIETMQNIDQLKESLADVVQRDAIKEELDFLRRFACVYK